LPEVLTPFRHSRPIFLGLLNWGAIKTPGYLIRPIFSQYLIPELSNKKSTIAERSGSVSFIYFKNCGG
jgi:hypothetical protein